MGEAGEKLIKTSFNSLIQVYALQPAVAIMFGTYVASLYKLVNVCKFISTDEKLIIIKDQKTSSF